MECLSGGTRLYTCGEKKKKTTWKSSGEEKDDNARRKTSEIDRRSESLVMMYTYINRYTIDAPSYI